MGFPKFVTPAAFQFTHPGKGATKREERALRKYEVSIHAPWEGCDMVTAL